MYIFYGHRILDDKTAKKASGPDKENTVSISEFEYTLDALEDFECTTLNDIHQPTNNTKRFSLTFDDGFKDNLEIILPLLKERGLSATYFVSGRFVQGDIPFEYELWNRLLKLGTTEKYDILRKQLKNKSRKSRAQALSTLGNHAAHKPDPNHLMLSEDEIKEISNSPAVTIGSHSHNHLALSKQDPFSVFYELWNSKKYLESVTQNSIDFFAYPYGARSFWTDLLARLAGYKRTFSTRAEKTNTNKFCLPRIPLKEAKSFISASQN